MQVYKDTVIPFGAIISPSYGYFQNSITVYGFAEVGATVSLTISDTDADTRNIVITPISVTAAGDWTVVNINISSLVDGSITLSATITDAAGNANILTVTTLMKDTVAAISITSNQWLVRQLHDSFRSGSVRKRRCAWICDSRSNRLSKKQNHIHNDSRGGPNLESAHKFVFGKLCGRNVTLVASIVDPAGNEASSTTIVLTKDTMISGIITSPLPSYIGSTVSVWNRRNRSNCFTEHC